MCVYVWFVRAFGVHWVYDCITCNGKMAWCERAEGMDENKNEIQTQLLSIHCRWFARLRAAAQTMRVQYTHSHMGGWALAVCSTHIAIYLFLFHRGKSSEPPRKSDHRLVFYLREECACASEYTVNLDGKRFWLRIGWSFKLHIAYTRICDKVAASVLANSFCICTSLHCWCGVWVQLWFIHINAQLATAPAATDGVSELEK